MHGDDSETSRQDDEDSSRCTLLDELALQQDGAWNEQLSGFQNFCCTFLRVYRKLVMAQPILIQDHVAYDPWKVLAAVVLLNKTSGKLAVPVFFSIMESWPTPQALSQATPADLECVVKKLGLGKTRSERLIALSKTFLDDPPVPGRFRLSRCYINAGVQADDDELSSVVRRRYPPTPASHLPGSGPYALDSYRIFCGGDDEWKAVMPHDKELVKFLKWKWAIVELRRWEPLCGPGDTVDIDYMENLIAELAR